MTRAFAVLCAVGVLGLAVGCQLGSQSNPPKGSQQEAVADYKAKLDGLDKKLADLKAKAEKATGDEKTKLDGKVTAATAKREAFVKKYEAMKSAAADKWGDSKTEVAAAYEEYRKAVE